MPKRLIHSEVREFVMNKLKNINDRPETNMIVRKAERKAAIEALLSVINFIDDRRSRHEKQI